MLAHDDLGKATATTPVNAHLGTSSCRAASRWSLRTGNCVSPAASGLSPVAMGLRPRWTGTVIAMITYFSSDPGDAAASRWSRRTPVRMRRLRRTLARNACLLWDCRRREDGKIGRPYCGMAPAALRLFLVVSGSCTTCCRCQHGPTGRVEWPGKVETTFCRCQYTAAKRRWLLGEFSGFPKKLHYK